MIYFPLKYHKKDLDGYPMKQWANEKATMPEMKFSLQVPVCFKLIRADMEPPSIDRPFIDCAYFNSPEKDIQVLVQCSFIQSEVSLDNYFLYFVNIAHETVLEQKADRGGEKPDILLQKKFADGQTWITRKTGFKIWNGHGAFVIIVNAACNKNDYTKYASLFLAITSSLRPLQTPIYNKAERLKILTRRFPFDFATYIPYSWKEVHRHNDTMQEMRLMYAKELRGSVTGVFSIWCFLFDTSFYTIRHVLEKVHKLYKDQGYNLTELKLMETGELRGFSNAVKGYLNIFNNKENIANPSNLTFYLGKKNKAWFYIEIFGPAKETDFEAWALNDTAMEIAIRNLVSI